MMRPTYKHIIHRREVVVICACAPDLPGCVAGADTLEEVKQLMQEAVEIDIEGTRADGLAIPEPSTEVARIEVRRLISTDGELFCVESGR